MVHGYIQIDELEKEIIDTPNFQRLKDIRQLTAQQAYPSANHTRFEHSLGVLHLAKKAFYNLRPLLIEKYDLDPEKFKLMLLHLRIAALLHDVGHAPFSHLGEKYYRKPEIKDNIKALIQARAFTIDTSIFEFGSSHELMSCYVILKKYADTIINASADINLELICRAIVRVKFASRESKWLENIVIELINSDTIDSDKLDYLMRDSFMTGVTVPEIDTTRLFRNIFINPSLKSLTFRDKAIPVIQNIIDARDSMYLWVYNHHTAVYTDFVMDFYIKHLAVNFEKQNKFKDKMDLNKFFSCNAISELLVSDSDLRNKLGEPISLENKDMSKYTGNILPQLFYRDFLKPLWKTIYEYKDFMTKYIPDTRLRKEFENRMCDNDHIFRRYVAKRLIQECNLDLGEVFIVPRSNKFYSLNPEKSTFNVYIESGDRDIKELLPQKDFKELYNNVNFYVFGSKSKVSLIQEKFIELIKKPLPDKESLPNDATKLEWFNYSQA